MSNYEKPVASIVEEKTEGVFMASGTKLVCRFGRTDAGAGVDTCQSCSKSGGTVPDLKNTFKSDYTGCVDNMPEKQVL